jgi:CRP-like cAMP-binding protein
MPSSELTAAKPQNRLLTELSPEDQRKFLEKTEMVGLAQGQILHDHNETPRFIYFPTTAVISLRTVMDSGASIEVVAVGAEGILGMRSCLDTEPPLGQAVTQVPGEALRMSAHAFNEEVAGNVALCKLLGRYISSLLAQVFQIAACNGLHSTEQRYARWLLGMQDRIKSSDVPVTQELLAEMLGVRRQSVSHVAGSLQKSDAIRYRRGKIKILNRRALETVSCECYRRIHEEIVRFGGSGS